jgi:hypothetical protein
MQRTGGEHAVRQVCSQLGQALQLAAHQRCLMPYLKKY